jgi:hypothetical protein
MDNAAATEWTPRRSTVGDESRTIRIAPAHGVGGAFWFAGWLFTIGFAKLAWWKVLIGLIVWPLFLGGAVR